MSQSEGSQSECQGGRGSEEGDAGPFSNKGESLSHHVVACSNRFGKKFFAGEEVERRNSRIKGSIADAVGREVGVRGRPRRRREAVIKEWLSRMSEG